MLSCYPGPGPRFIKQCRNLRQFPFSFFKLINEANVCSSSYSYFYWADSHKYLHQFSLLRVSQVALIKKHWKLTSNTKSLYETRPWCASHMYDAILSIDLLCTLACYVPHGHWSSYFVFCLVVPARCSQAGTVQITRRGKLLDSDPGDGWSLSWTRCQVYPLVRWSAVTTRCVAEELSQGLPAGEHRINLKDADRSARYFTEVLSAKLKAAGVEFGSRL